MRTLASNPITLSNDSHETKLLYQGDMKDHTSRLKSTNLSPQDLFFGHERFWIPSIIVACLVLNLQCREPVLDPLHTALLSKLKIMYNFPLAMHSVLIEVVGLNLRSLEIKSRAQEIQHLVSLFTSDSPKKLLLLNAMEHHQLELGAEQLFLSSSHVKLHNLAISS